MSGASLPTIEVPLTFIAPTTTKPRVLMSANHAEANRRNGDFRSLPVDVADARSLSERPTLDGEGFALVKNRTSVADFYDPAAVEQVYYVEIPELLRRSTAAAEVIRCASVEDDPKPISRARAPATVRRLKLVRRARFRQKQKWARVIPFWLK